MLITDFKNLTESISFVLSGRYLFQFPFLISPSEFCNSKWNFSFDQLYPGIINVTWDSLPMNSQPNRHVYRYILMYNNTNTGQQNVIISDKLNASARHLQPNTLYSFQLVGYDPQSFNCSILHSCEKRVTIDNGKLT